MAKIICFITDGGGYLGLGHVQQSTTFAKELNGAFEIVFISKSDSVVCDKINDSGFQVCRCNNDYEVLKELRHYNPKVVIIDKIDVEEDLAKNIKTDFGCALIIFTNLTQANRYADVAVTADIGSNFRNIRFVDESTKTLYLFGPKYWVLKKDFYEYSKMRKPLLAEVRKILLIFGGSDPANLTSETLRHLLKAQRPCHVDVVIGANFQHYPELNQVLVECETDLVDVSIHKNIANVAELMFGADLVVASPGLSAFEALRVGTPIVVVPHDDLQKETYRGVFSLLERDQLAELVDKIEKREFSFPNELGIVEMEIGAGVGELKEIVLDLAGVDCHEVD